MALLCGQDCCVGTPIQQLVVEAFMPSVITEVHLYSSGYVELDYTLAEFDPDEDFTPHVAHVFHSLGAALTFAVANQHKMRVDDRIKWLDEWGEFGEFAPENVLMFAQVACLVRW